MSRRNEGRGGRVDRGGAGAGGGAGGCDVKSGLHLEALGTATTGS